MDVSSSFSSPRPPFTLYGQRFVPCHRRICHWLRRIKRKKPQRGRVEGRAISKIRNAEALLPGCWIRRKIDWRGVTFALVLLTPIDVPLKRFSEGKKESTASSSLLLLPLLLIERTRGFPENLRIRESNEFISETDKSCDSDGISRGIAWREYAFRIPLDSRINKIYCVIFLRYLFNISSRFLLVSVHRSMHRCLSSLSGKRCVLSNSKYPTR